LSHRLVLLLGDFEHSDKNIANVLKEWSAAGILGTVAWTNVQTDGLVRPMTALFESEKFLQLELFELLTSRIWSQVTVVGVRQQPVNLLSAQRFEAESQLLDMVQRAFEAHRDLEFQSFTVSIAEQEGLIYEAFSPDWKMHILHEPIVRIDQAVAAQPMWEDHRHLLVSLLALTMAGGFVWQLGALAPEMADQVIGAHRPIRVGRAYLRVVSAGRLTDEVLAGAFPKSGPWSIPTDVPNAQAVPPGTPVADSLIDALVTRGKFKYRPWTDPKREKPKDLGILEGLKLFAKEFGSALRSIPVSLVEKVKSDIEGFMQKLTFGEGASVLLRFDPRKDDLNADNVLEVIKNLQLGNTVDAIGDADPWNVLQRVSLGAVDGGRFPDGMTPPASGSGRIIYTDPASIGPAPDDESFHVTAFEVELLRLTETQKIIGPMAVADGLTLKTHLDAMRDELAVKLTSLADKKPTTDSKSKAQSVSNPGTSTKKLGRIKRWRLRRKEKRALRKAAKQAKKSPQLPQQVVTPVAIPSDIPVTTAGGSVAPTPPGAPGQIVALEGKDPTLGEAGVPKISDEDETQRHSPSHPNFDPREYTPIGVFYQGSRQEILEEYVDANKVYESAKTSYASANGRFAKNQSCDHCGTQFDHGLLYIHEPTKKLVRVGNICARKSLPAPGDSDLVVARLADLEKRFSEWLSRRSGSLLWRVGDAIISGLVVARRDLAKCLEVLAARPVIEEASTAARIKFAKWTRRGVMSVIFVIAAALASVVLTPFPLFIAVLIMTVYFSGFIIRMLYLARDIVRAQYKFRLAIDEYERSYSRARHDVEEVVRLSSVNEQFQDWQVIIRELVHLPFGREIGFATARVGIDEVTRPPAMVLGKSRPDDKQRMQLFLQARRQTIHAGWLLEILDMLRDEWKSDYENSRLTTSADNILPEADIAPSGSLVGKQPLSDEDVYYPRTDFRYRVVAGDLQRALVKKKAEQVAVDLRQTALGRLLAKVEVAGLGSALSGQSVEEFLSGLSIDSEDKIAFPADLISNKYPSHRLFEPTVILPPYGSLNAETGQLQVQPGVELTAAAWRVELSAPLEPLEILKGFEAAARFTAENTPQKNVEPKIF